MPLRLFPPTRRKPKARARFWLAGTDDDLDTIYPAEGGGDPQAISRLNMDLSAIRSGHKRPRTALEKAPALLPPPPPMFSTAQSAGFVSPWAGFASPWPDSRPWARACLGFLFVSTTAATLLFNDPFAQLSQYAHLLAFPYSALEGKAGLGGSSGAGGEARDGLDRWLKTQGKVAWDGVLSNIGPPAGVKDGIVIASPSTGKETGREEPDYFYTWTRDAALTLSALLPEVMPAYTRPWEGGWNASAVSRKHTASHPLLEGLLRSYTAAQAEIQAAPNPSGDLWSGGLSEPKFLVSGGAFTGSWGRPQRDGPALRALALIPYAHWLLDRGHAADLDYVLEHLYDPHSVRKPGSVIKNDLEEVAARWAEDGFDLWEEVKGRHLFTDAVSRRTLQAGAGLAARMDDGKAGQYYLSQAELVGDELDLYATDGRLRGYLDNVPGRSGLDAAILLASIHAGSDLPSEIELAPSHPAVLNSLRAFVQSFNGLYAINSGNWTSGWLVGRYAEDVYDGIGMSRGNPWYITTLAVAHVLYEARANLVRAGVIDTGAARAFWADILGVSEEEIPAQWRRRGGVDSWVRGGGRFQDAIDGLGRVADAFLGRVKDCVQKHKGRMSEQVGRDDGREVGARDLTWSYAALLAAKRAREA